MVTDIPDQEVKFKIIEQGHKRAHRNAKENKDEILERYYFPQRTKLIKKYTVNMYEKYIP